MAKTNYSFEKRQREIAKKKKKEEKRLRKLGKTEEDIEGEPGTVAEDQSSSEATTDASADPSTEPPASTP
jgi:hypothetical protein